MFESGNQADQDIPRKKSMTKSSERKPRETERKYPIFLASEGSLLW